MEQPPKSECVLALDLIEFHSDCVVLADIHSSAANRLRRRGGSLHGGGPYA